MPIISYCFQQVFEYLVPEADCKEIASPPPENTILWYTEATDILCAGRGRKRLPCARWQSDGLEICANTGVPRSGALRVVLRKRKGIVAAPYNLS